MARWGAATRLTALAAATLVAGCSWFGEADKPKLAGTRISVLQGKRALEADPAASKEQIRLPRPQAVADWPGAGGFPDHAMHHLELGDASREIWSQSIGAGSSRETLLLAQPVVAGGRLFAIDAEAQVSAFNAATGAKLWSVSLAPKTEADSPSSGGVAVLGDRVFVTTGFAQIAALEAATGKELWRQPLTAPARGGPTASGDRIFAASIDNQLTAFAYDDGRKLWSHSAITENAGLLGGSAPAVDGGVVVAGFSSGEIFALRTETGRVIWADSLVALRRSDPVSGLADIKGRPVIDRGVVIAVSNSGRLAAFDQRQGARMWELDVQGREQPWVAGDYVYVLSTTGELYCIGRRDGRIRWVRELQQFENQEKKKDPIVWTGPVLAGDRLIVAGSQGTALAISPYTGEPLGSIKLRDKVLTAPIVAGETLYILTDDGRLSAYR